MARLRSIGSCAAILLALGAGPAMAQTAPSASANGPVDPVYDGQKAAFLALPEGQRKSIQDSLAWLGLYNGVVDGGFGKRTRDSIVAYQTGIHATVDGVLGPSLVAALTAAADKARAAVGFQIVEDAKTGMRYGAPLKLLDKRNGLALTRADGTMALTFDEKTGADADLSALYAKSTTPGGSGKVSYKALKAGAFFVVAGVANGKKFYTRYDLSPDAAKPDLRGFTFAYPEARTDLDRVTLAIANSFEPFKSAPAPVALAGAAPPPKSNPTPAATGAKSAQTIAPPPGFAGIALAIGPGQAITTLPASACAHPKIAGKPATYGPETAPPFTLSGDFAPKATAPALASAPTDEGVVVAFAEIDPTKLVASDAKIVSFGADRAVIAPLARGGLGAPVFARDGALLGMVADSNLKSPRVDGALIGAPHAMMGGAEIAKLLSGDAAQPGEAMSLGDLLKAEANAVLGVSCGP